MMFPECEADHLARKCVDKCSTCGKPIGMTNHCVVDPDGPEGPQEPKTYHFDPECMGDRLNDVYELHGADGVVHKMNYTSERTPKPPVVSESEQSS